MRPLLVLALLALAGCGADGAPLRPTGSVEAGLGSDGAIAGGEIGVSDGIFSLGLSL